MSFIGKMAGASTLLLLAAGAALRFAVLSPVQAAECGPVITIGDNCTATIGSAGETDAFGLAGNTGDRIFARVARGSLIAPRVDVKRPDGTTLCSGWGTYYGSVSCVLDQSGTFQVIARSNSPSSTGAYGLYVQRTTAPLNASPAIFGQNYTSSLANASVDDYTIDVAAGDRIYARAGKNTLWWPRVEVHGPNGLLCADFKQYNATVDCVATASGTYTVMTMSEYAYSGTHGVYIQRTSNPLNAPKLPVDILVSGTLGGGTVDDYRLEVPAGAQVHLEARRVTLWWPRVEVHGPGGILCSGSGQYLVSLDCTIPTSDPHVVMVMGQYDYAGTYTLCAYVCSPGQTTPPAPTTSRYMSTVDQGTLYALGCNQWGENGIAVLDFGQPQLIGTAYGTRLFDANQTVVTIAQIELAMRSWISGYWSCSTSGSKIYVAAGTNNFVGTTGTVNADHGNAWAEMINRLNDWVGSQGWWSRVGVRGASDIELGYSSAAAARAWAEGYDELGHYAYYNFGDAQGCPPYDGGNGWCDLDAAQPFNPNIDWALEDVWYVSWGLQHAYPLPEIYCLVCPPGSGDTNGGNAAQWYKMSLYSYLNHGYRMRMVGSFTQCQAEIDEMGPCTNTPGDGWQQLYDKLNSDPRTDQELPYSTDVTWLPRH